YLISRAWWVRVIHIYREGNHLADYLASKGHELPMRTHTITHTDDKLIYWRRYDIVGASES
ncbi:hypothetical protein LINPERPRIM_LOCUS22501, partial [Linum perenne]